MARSPDAWPEEWRRQYLETIRRAVESHRDATHYALRLDILREGFEPCWEALTKNKDRPLFEVYRCRMRWYVEHLMGTEFPSEDERQRLRNQYTDVWYYAASSLVIQFPFLDANAVQAAKTDDLSICYGKIDAPLMPVYLRPLAAEQVGQIKQRWDDLRYACVDLWRRLGGGSTTPSENLDAPSPNPERDYDLTKKSLSQLLGLIWMVEGVDSCFTGFLILYNCYSIPTVADLYGRLQPEKFREIWDKLNSRKKDITEINKM